MLHQAQTSLPVPFALNPERVAQAPTPYQSANYNYEGRDQRENRRTTKQPANYSRGKVLE